MIAIIGTSDQPCCWQKLVTFFFFFLAGSSRLPRFHEDLNMIAMIGTSTVTSTGVTSDRLVGWQKVVKHPLWMVSGYTVWRFFRRINHDYRNKHVGPTLLNFCC